MMRLLSQVFKTLHLLKQAKKCPPVLIDQFKSGIETIQARIPLDKPKPKIYFEEWFHPLISGIQWVSELIELAGGIDLYQHKQPASLAKDRIITDPDEVVSLNPDIIIASWCGKKFKKEKLVSRPYWSTINAVKYDFVFEINSSLILQPGPAALTEGIQKIAGFIDQWQLRNHAD